MKKNTLLYIIITILLIVIAVGITYIIMDNKNNEEITEPNNNDNNQGENNNKEENNDEQITFSESELEEYLSYIPAEPIEMKENVYKNPTNINNISKNSLLATTLNKASGIYWTTAELGINATSINNYQDFVNSEYNILYKKQDIDNLMQKMFNTTSGNLNNTDDDYIATYNMCYYYNNGYFEETNCVGTLGKLNNIKSYEIQNGDLVIYEYYVELDELQWKITDLYTNQTISLECNISNTTEDCQQKANDYFKDNLDKFTLYKHTFKKNDTGYYWYSTEIASEG